MKLIRVNDLVLCLEDETKPPKQSKHYFTIGGKQAADFLMECFNKNAAAPAAQGDAKDSSLIDILQKAIGWCEDPGFRTDHTAKQMQTLLDGMRKEFIAAIAAKAAS